MMVKASGSAPCASCKREIARGATVRKTNAGIVCLPCTRLVTVSTIADELGTTVAQLKRLLVLAKIPHRGTRPNPTFKSAPPMLLYARTAITRLRKMPETTKAAARPGRETARAGEIASASERRPTRRERGRAADRIVERELDGIDKQDFDPPAPPRVVHSETSSPPARVVIRFKREEKEGIEIIDALFRDAELSR